LAFDIGASHEASQKYSLTKIAILGYPLKCNIVIIFCFKELIGLGYKRNT
jgi:hypothetical protein